MTHLPVDREQIAQFVKTVFRHASAGQTISMRAFFEGADKRPFEIKTIRIDGQTGLDPVIELAVQVAQRAAEAPEPIVFCPIPATFKDETSARETNLSEGLVLCVECDSHPVKAQGKLERELGPAALKVESGGHWTALDT